MDLLSYMLGKKAAKGQGPGLPAAAVDLSIPRYNAANQVWDASNVCTFLDGDSDHALIIGKLIAMMGDVITAMLTAGKTEYTYGTSLTGDYAESADGLAQAVWNALGTDRVPYVYFGDTFGVFPTVLQVKQLSRDPDSYYDLLTTSAYCGLVPGVGYVVVEFSTVITKRSDSHVLLMRATRYVPDNT